MNIITLNTWGGRIHKELIDFLQKNKGVDVFCFQEIYHRATHTHLEQAGINPSLTLLDDIEKILTNHKGYFRPHYLDSYGLAIFVHNDLMVVHEGELFVHQHKGYIPNGAVGNHARNIQVVSINSPGGKVNIFNFHGLWNGMGKTDTEARILQSQKLIDYIKEFPGKNILCGDFNLLPETQSLKMIESIPMRNLNKDNNVISTRSSYYTKKDKFADYIFVNELVEVKNFAVLPDEISDHLPLYIEFE